MGRVKGDRVVYVRVVYLPITVALPAGGYGKCCIVCDIGNAFGHIKLRFKISKIPFAVEEHIVFVFRFISRYCFFSGGIGKIECSGGKAVFADLAHIELNALFHFGELLLFFDFYVDAVDLNVVICSYKNIFRAVDHSRFHNVELFGVYFYDNVRRFELKAFAVYYIAR